MGMYMGMYMGTNSLAQSIIAGHYGISSHMLNVIRVQLEVIKVQLEVIRGN